MTIVKRIAFGSANMKEKYDSVPTILNCYVIILSANAKSNTCLTGRRVAGNYLRGAINHVLFLYIRFKYRLISGSASFTPQKN